MPQTPNGFDLRRVESAVARLLRRARAVPLSRVYAEVDKNISIAHRKMIIRCLKRSKKYILIPKANSGPLHQNGGLWVEKRRQEGGK